jgi:rod shape determining protein RodA
MMRWFDLFPPAPVPKTRQPQRPGKFLVGPLPALERSKSRLTDRILGIGWGVVLLVSVIAGIGIAALYSAANGSMQPWASKQTSRFAIALIPMLGAAMFGVRYWFRVAYWIYAVVLFLVLAVDLRGFTGMGAQRWIDLGIIQLQPSELMSLALVLSLARYFHRLSEDNLTKFRYLILPIVMIFIPVALVLKQPDLGTAMVLLLGGVGLLFLAGVRLRVFAFMCAAAGVALPLVWRFLRGYQKSRIYTYLDPESDPLGAGYHILQSKIALGSGGLFGTGFLLGTQSHLNFLPERQTDFIFTTLAEEFGLVGALTLIILYMALIMYGYAIALRSRNHFGRLLGLGIVNNFFLYVFINIGMVSGLLPVVGVPLPLISYGGSAMLTAMIGFGLLMSVYVDRDVRLNRVGELRPD